jgi:DNA-directed RNA polymerase alpha subunit
MKYNEETTLSCIGLPARLVNTLETSLGIVYVVDLCKFTAEDLLRLPGFGEKLLRHVRDKLATVGAHLSSERLPLVVETKQDKPSTYSPDLEAFG